MEIKVYADEHGVGIYDQSWREDWETGHFCSDLRLDDELAYLRFMREMLAGGYTLGWLPKEIWEEDVVDKKEGLDYQD